MTSPHTSRSRQGWIYQQHTIFFFHNLMESQPPITSPKVVIQAPSSTQIFHHDPRKFFHRTPNQGVPSRHLRPGLTYPVSCRRHDNPRNWNIAVTILRLHKWQKCTAYHILSSMSKYESFIASLSSGTRDACRACLSRKAWYCSFVIVRLRASRRELESGPVFSESRSKTWNTCLWGLAELYRHHVNVTP